MSEKVDMRIVFAVVFFLSLGSVGWAVPDPIQLYNQACEAALAGKQEMALEHLRGALDAGFEDMRFAQRDPDLASVVGTDGFADLMALHRNRLILLGAEKGLVLKKGLWTDRESFADASDFRLRWDNQALAFEVRLKGHDSRALQGTVRAPWLGGPGLLITLAVPDSTSSFESRNTFHLAFGKSKSDPVGALFVDAGRGWQKVHQLAPTIENDGKTLRITGGIPWQTILPYHPLADEQLGFNISLRNAEQSPIQSLIPDPAAFAPARPIHRFAPLNMDLSSYFGDGLVGKLSHSLVEDQPLDLELSMYADQQGAGQLTIDFLDMQKRSVLPGGALPTPVDLDAGLNRIQRQADFSALNRGPYLLKVSLRTPGGSLLTWSSMVLHLGVGWREETVRRIMALPREEQDTGRFYFETINQAVGSLQARRHPGSLTTTLLELNNLLNAGQTHGSILPDQGIFRMAYPTRDNLNLVTLFLPPGHREAKKLRPVILWHDAPGLERVLTERLERLYEYDSPAPPIPAADRETFPVYLIPRIHPDLAGSSDATALEILTQWARRYFRTDRTLLVGLDGGASPLLHLFSEKHVEADAVMILAGRRLSVWPQASVEDVASQLQPGAKQTPPVTWLDFFKETRQAGQGQLLLSALQICGYNLASVQAVAGGLSMTQAADRVALWAEGTP